MFERLKRWPLLKQLRDRSDGTGEAAVSDATKRLRARITGASVTRSVCPYCAVGCGQLIHHRDGALLSIEGDPESPISQGTLCPKGAASRELLTHEHRLDRVRYRAPHSDRWEDMTLDDALDRIADRVWESRQRAFVSERNGHILNQATNIAHLGGATLDNEENYLIKKLFTGGLGMARVSNQARI